MNKRLKSLVCIWLVAIMLVGMLSVSAAAGSSTQQSNATLWTGTVPLREASDFSGLEGVNIQPGTSLNQTYADLKKTPPAGTDLLSWVRWGSFDSGLTSVAPPVEYPANYAVSEFDLAGDYIFEPVFSNVKIKTQPAVNNFTTGVQVYAVSNDTTPNAYAWRAAVENEPGLTYQWYQQTQAKINWPSPQPSAQEESGGEVLQRSAIEVLGKISDGTLTSEDGNPIMLILELESGDTLTVTPDGTADVGIFRVLGQALMLSSGFAADGTYSVTNDTSVAATYGVIITSDSSETFSATVDVTAAVELPGRTSASLLTGDPLTAGTYLCKVSYDSDIGDGAEAEANYVYTAWSDPVVYTHTHCVCGATHAAVGDHTAPVSTVFTPITDQAGLQAAATTGGNVYLANDIELTSTITVADDLTLCLNGKKLYYTGSGKVSIFTVEEGATLNLTDCGDTERRGYVDGDTYLWTPGTAVDEDDIPYNLTGGLVTGGTGCKTNPNSGYSYGGAVYANPGSKFNLYGGNIAGNDTTYAGGGVCGKNASVAVYDGCMVGNDTGAISIWDLDGYDENFPTLSIYGGKLEYNRAQDNYTGEIDVDGPITMTGGTVTAEHSNLAMQLLSNAFTMTGGTVTCNQHWGTAVQFNGIADYTETQEGNTVYMTATPAKVTLSGGTINAPSAGYGLALFYSYSDLYLSGAPVLTDNDSYAAIAIYRAEENYTEEYEGTTIVDSCSTGHIVLTGQLSWQEPVLIQVFAEGSDEYADPSTLDFTKDWSTYMGDADPADYFTSGHYSAEVAKNAQTGELKIAESYYVILRDAEDFYEPAQTENGSYDVDKYSATEGDTVTITATTENGYEVAQVTVSEFSWGPMSLSATEEQGEENAEILVTKNSDGTYSFVMPAYAVEVRVTFKVKTVGVTITANPTAGGEVTGLVAGGSYNHGDTVTLTAAPNKGYRFVNWTKDGEVVSTNATYSFVATADCTLVANFEVNTYGVTVTANPTVGGSVEGGGTYNHGAEVTLTATPAAGYKFVNWTEGETVVGTEKTFSFTATENRTLVANFVESHEHKLCQVNSCTLDHNGDGQVNDHGSVAFATKVSNLPQLQAAATNGGNVVLTDDIYVDSTITVAENKTLNICLNGKNIYYKVTGGSVFKVSANATLNITDCSVGGDNGIISKNGDNFNGIVNNGTVTIYGGKITGTAYGVKNNGTLTIAGGTVHSTGNSGIGNMPDGTVYVVGGEITGNNYGIRNGGIYDDRGNSLDGGTVYISGGQVSKMFNTLSGQVTVNGTAKVTHILNRAILTVSGGTVNSITNEASGTLTITGGNITSTSGTAIDNTGTLYLSGNPIITGSSGTSIYTNQPFTVTGALTGENNSIVVNMSGTGVFAINGAPYISIFKSRYSDKKIVADGDDLKLVEKTIAITANASEGGGVEGGGSYNHGDTVALTAAPAAGYKFVNWTEDGVQVSTSAEYTFTAEASCTLVANFERDTYTIKFLNADGTELQSSKVAYGETPVYTGETPTKADNAQYTYTFDGWSPAIEAVSGEATYTAQFSTTVNKYTVTWIVDGEETTEEYEYGAMPTRADPTKAADAQYTYTFTGWGKEIAAVTGDATYTAQFSTTVNKYTVTFYAEDGTTVLESKEWEYGQNPVYNNGQNPTKPATTEKSYTFAGWTPAVVTVSGNASYTATFTDATNTYTVTWYNEDGTTVLETATWAYGSVPSFTKPTPAKAADAENTYAFKEWVAMSGLDSDGKVTGDASFKASYTATKINYTGTVSPEEGTMDNVTADGLGEVAEEINKNIVLTVKVEAADANDTEQTAIKGAAGSRTLEFMDITLKDNSGNPVEVPQGTVLEIEIPFTVGNKLNITVYRHHDGSAAAFTSLNARAADDARTDGTFYVDSMNNKIYIYTNKFSTYAIGYSEPAPYSPPIYSITAVDGENGKITVSSKWAYFSSTVTITVKPDAGYQLGTLAVTDTMGNEIALRAKDDGTYTFMMPSRNVKVKVTFVSNGSYATCTGDSSCPMYGYTDLDCEAWYHDGVHYAIEKGLMSGYGDGIFKPNADTTRAMITVMLWRLNGSPVVNYLLDFEDVAEGQWYTEAIRWAKSEGIAGGYGNGYFGTNDAITREQMVTILWRYAKYKGADVSVGEDTNILSYNDASDVAEYAIPAMQWACGSGMVQGTNDPNGEGMILDPESNAVRAQAATLMQRFFENILK